MSDSRDVERARRAAERIRKLLDISDDIGPAAVKATATGSRGTE